MNSPTTPPASRFQRQPASAAAAKSTSPEPVSGTLEKTAKPSHGHNADLISDGEIKQLQERLQKTKERRMRREFEREQAQKELDACKAQAKELGASSLEELEELVKKAQEADRLAMNAFLEQLAQEEELLDRIDQQLKDLDEAK